MGNFYRDRIQFILSEYPAALLRLETAEWNKPCSLRHASATHKSETLNESQLRLYYGWELDSKMPSKYVHQDEKSLRTALRKYSGMPAEEEILETVPTKPKTCSRCHKENSAFACFCMQCGLELDVKTAMDIEDKIRKADGIRKAE